MNDEQDRTASQSSVDALLEDLESELDGAGTVCTPARKRGAVASFLAMREISVLGATVLLFVALALAAPGRD